MSTAQYLALLVCSFCMAALLVGLVRPAWVLPARRATRGKVLLLYSAASVLMLLLAGELPDHSAHAQSPDEGDAVEPAPESLRAVASRMLTALGLGSGHRLRIGQLTLSYEDPVTEDQAAALGEFLSRSPAFTSSGVANGSGHTSAGRASSSSSRDYGHGHSPINVQVRKNGQSPMGPEVYELRIATPFSRLQQLDSETRAAYQLVGLLASGIAFDGAPVQVQVCTSLLSPLLILRPPLATLSVPVASSR